MPDNNQVADDDSINPVDLHYTQNYHSNYQSQQQQQQLLENQNGATKNKKLFPKKLWDLINDDKYHYCLRWSDDGQLVYLNRDDFEDSYLKTAENQFHTQKAISFVRQMNMYGFRKVDDCFYENDNFKRDSEHLLKNMIRKHPNKNQINDDISQTSFHNNLYNRNNVSTNSTRIATPSSTAATPTSLLQTTSNLSLLVPPNSIDSSFQNHLAFPIYGNGTQLFNSRDILTNQPQRLTINEDSLSSSGDNCCSTGSGSGSQTDTLTCVLDRIDSTNQQQFTDLQNSLAEVEKNINMANRRVERSNLHTQHQRTLNPFHFSQAGSPTGEASGQNLMANQFHNNQFGNFPASNMNLNMMNLKPMLATPNSSPLNNENTCDEINQRQNILLSLYSPDQREIIKALMAQQQQTNTYLSRELNSANLQQEQNYNAFYNLLSSISSNLYPPNHLVQGDPQNLFDTKRLHNLQQIYQSLFSRQDCFVPSESRQNSLTPRRSDSSGVQSSASNSTDSTATSLLARDKPTAASIKQEKNSDATQNGIKNDCELIDKTNDRCNGNLSSELDFTVKRRDNKTNRSFKRSIDSILDSHGNHGLDKANIHKKTIIEYEKARNSDNQDITVNRYARELVAQIASNKAARVDSEVIAEASRYTERFVETLFDTAQVIARHSNGSSSSDSINENRPIGEDKESKDDRVINLSDITSAVRLLPSKLPKILK